MFTKDSLTIQKYLEQNTKISKNGFKELKLLYEFLKKVKYNYNPVRNQEQFEKYFNQQVPFEPVRDKETGEYVEPKNKYTVEIRRAMFS
jgi:hypothetical protein